jgi:Multiubiquitin
MSNDNSFDTPGHKKSYDIVVNGKQRSIADNRISYDQIIRIAFPEGPFDVVFTVAYANPHGKDGTLASGQDTHVHEGMSFNVVKTNRS